MYGYMVISSQLWTKKNDVKLYFKCTIMLHGIQNNSSKKCSDLYILKYTYTFQNLFTSEITFTSHFTIK